tara:strand:- start:6021 stop:6611 length:591 start_codon:yes stop_codon:yes gene_type:complete
LINPSKKIKFAYCTDLIVENSLYDERNEHYYYDDLIQEFWLNYNTNRKRLYHTVLQQLKLNRETINSVKQALFELMPMNRSSIVFISNNLSANHCHNDEVMSDPRDIDSIRDLFMKTNKVSNLEHISSFKPSEGCTVLECTKYNSNLQQLYHYFSKVIDECESIYVITDHSGFMSRFTNHIHINDEYYLCYNKETS